MSASPDSEPAPTPETEPARVDATPAALELIGSFESEEAQP